MVCDYRKLDVWKLGIELCVEMYRMTRSFPEYELYGLSSQMRRAAVFVSSNIAEGCGKPTKKDMVRYLYNALGSVKELESQLLIAFRLRYVKDVEYDRMVSVCCKVGKMLNGLIKYYKGVG